MPAVNVGDEDDAKLVHTDEMATENDQEGTNEVPVPSSSATYPQISYHPRYVISTLTFGWMKPLLELGKKKALEADDLFPLRPQDCANNVEEEFQRQWTHQLNGTARFHKGAPSLTWAFMFAFGRPFALAGCFKLCHDFLLFVGPNLLKRIILFLEQPELSIYIGLAYVLGLFLSNWGMSLCLRQYFFHSYSVGMRLRSASIAAVYQKALALSASSISQRSTGEITNLMSVDSQRLQELTLHLHAVWYSFVQVGLAVAFLWHELGPSCLAGCLVILLTVPLSTWVTKKMKVLQTDLMTAKDERQKVNNEVISGMKGIKMQAWESSFKERLQSLRDKEQAILKKYFLFKTFSNTTWSSTPLVVSLVTFACYVALGNTLNVAKALTSIAFFEILRFPLYMFPTVLNNVVEAAVTIDRLENFLLSEEKEPVGSGALEKPGAEIDVGTFVWDTPVLRKLVFQKESEFDAEQTKEKKKKKKSKSQAPQLYSSMAEKEWNISLLQSQLREAEKHISSLEAQMDQEGQLVPTPLLRPAEQDRERLLAISRVSLKAGTPQLVGIVGQVGSGKSTLLAAILGEVKTLSGTVAVQGKLAYVGQHPFIQNASLRDNILFGLPYDAARYCATIDACALRTDLQVLPHGDHTEIGEKGINLSGGQKARVALARAVYANADVYLLDDPLSAVDAHVGRTLFEKCVRGLLRRKCVIMVTNALQYLPQFDLIYVLRNGRIVESGSFTKLNAEVSGSFFNLMQANNDTLKILTENSSAVESPRIVESPQMTSSPTLGSIALSANCSFADTSVLEAAVPQMTQEEREIGSVTLAVYKSWVKASGGYIIFFLCAMVYGLSQTNDIATRWWLTHWSDIDDKGDEGSSHGTFWFLGWYALLNAGTCLFFFIQSFNIMMRGLAASHNLFCQLLQAVLRAPMSFFDTTPLGRVTNRFSKDLYTIDESLPNTVHTYLNCLSTVIGTLVVVCTVTPWFTLALIPLTGFYFYSQQYFLKTSRELKRLESLSRSPIYALFSETLDGLTTIRAFQAEERYMLRNKDHLDRNQRAYFLTFAGNCWLAIRLELAGTMIVTLAALFAVIEHGRHNDFASIAGLSISFALNVTQSLNWTVRMASQLESEMVSVERICQYTDHLLPEAPAHIPDADPSPEWPSLGEIIFRDVHLRYRPGLPLVLKGLTLSIKGHEKIGVVGRTGAGKSSLVVALLRLVELDEGSICIDGIDIKSIGLQPLRSSMAVIPQDPLLFSGTIRFNLDPFGTYSDVQLWNSIERVGLGHVLTSLSDVVEEGGRNFSIGQRQLLCIARALLLKSRIILMDEATAAIDVETDAMLQKIIRTEFASATTITIAHRLNTILDSDRVLVMDDGRAAEFDSPKVLMERQDSLFFGLVQNWEGSHATAAVGLPLRPSQ